MALGASSAVAVESGEQPDEALVRQVLGGNTAPFEMLMRRHNERVYRAARSIVRDEAEAEDVMQQAYVNAFTHLRQFNGSARFSTWLTRIAINEALARVRRQHLSLRQQGTSNRHRHRPSDKRLSVDLRSRKRRNLRRRHLLARRLERHHGRPDRHPSNHHDHRAQDA